MALLEIDGLRLTIGGRAVLQGVELTLEAGQILGLVGPSGSGKSSTALAVMGLSPEGAERQGAIRLDGVDLAGLDDAALCDLRGQSLGMVFQEPLAALNPVMSIGAQVAETVRLHRRLPAAEARRIADQALDKVELPAARFPRRRFPHELSGGQRQRVAIAIATALRPRLLIADEPTTALDVTTQAAVLALLRRLVREDGTALLLVSHDIAMLSGIADRIAVIDRGRIVEQGGALDLLRAPRHPVTQRLVKAALGRSRPAATPPAEGTPPVLEADGIVRDFTAPRWPWVARRHRRPAVDRVSLSLRPGERLGVVGESGSGKSTLLRCLLALDAPQAGEVRLAGAPFRPGLDRGSRRLRRLIQLVPQDPYGSFDPRWRVADIVAEPLSLLDPPPDAAARRHLVAEALTAVGLSSADGRRRPHAFSGGQRQRIAIARAIVTGPQILALDEATSALDLELRAHILDLLAALSRRQRMALLFVSHDLDAVRAIADRVLVMKDGQVVESGPTEQVFAHPQHPYTASLLAATPSLAEALERQRP